jgi:preprotein translocase subunit YajC
MANMLAVIALQAAAAPGAGPNRSLMVMLIYLVSFGLIAYFLLIRPQRKLQERQRTMLDALTRGDEVMTEGGIIGSVVHLQDDRVTIKSGESRLVVARSKIARVLGAPEPEKT